MNLKNKKMFVIEILNSTKKCWVASWDGDPPRTLKIENAQTFKSKKKAKNRILEVIKTHPFKEIIYEIQKVNDI